MTLPAVALLMLVNLLWSLNVVVSKIAVDDLGVPPLFYALARSVIVVAALLPLLRPVPRDLWRVMAVGLAISGGSFALLYVGLRTASPATAGVVGLSGAPLTVIFAILFLGERVRWKRALGIGLAFGGVLLAVSSPDALATGGGVALIFASAVMGALGTVFVKRLALSSLRLQAWAGVASILALSPLTLATETDQLASLVAAPVETAACLLFAGLVVSVGAHSAYFWLLQRYDTNQVVPLTLLSPLFTVVLGAWLTDDAVGARLVAGGLIALAGVAIIVLRPSETFSKRWIVRGRL
jgi:O-acetylserine/cysteine efflux transporter